MRSATLARVLSWAGAAIGVLALTLVLCAPVRAASGLPLMAATGIALLVAVGVAMLVRRAPSQSGTGPRWLGMFSLFAISVAALWNRAIGPLGAWVGSDAGIHVAYRDAFAATDPGAYDGFVSLYGTTWWIEKLGRTDAAWGFGLAFFAAVALIAATCGWGVDRALCTDGTVAPGPLRRTLALSVAAALLLGLTLPLVHYYQMDGFLTQVWGLLPVLAIWSLDASGLPRFTRLGLQLGVLVWARYTYGLVMADLLALVGVVAVSEVREAWQARRQLVGVSLGALTVVGAASYAAVRFFTQLVELIPKYGWFVKYDLELVTQGAALACAGLLAVQGLIPSLRRLLRVPVTVALANTVTSSLLQARYPGDHYYLQKYNFHALVCLSLAVAAALAYALCARDPARAGARRIAVAGAAVGALAALLTIGFCFKPVYPTYAERVLAPKIYQHLQPLVDFDARRRIRERLHAEKARFGGYLVAYGPMFNFMNAMFGREGGGFFAYEGLDRSPGHCVFWTPTGLRGWAPWGIPPWMNAAIHRLSAEPRTECRSYHAERGLGKNLQLCGTCF